MSLNYYPGNLEYIFKFPEGILKLKAFFFFLIGGKRVLRQQTFISYASKRKLYDSKIDK